MKTFSAYSCPRLPRFDDASWTTIRKGFAGALTLEMQQAWQATASAAFMPAQAHIGWQPDALLILAELGDEDIHNPVTGFNEVAFTKGDVFEIFLRPLPQLAYYELHVNPHNQKLQLRFPSADVFKNQRKTVPAGQDPLDSFRIPQEMFTSKTRIEKARDRWLVYAKIPWVSVVEEGGPCGAGSECLLSLCRYDYTRTRPQPVLSSTSPHRVCNYHRQQEWARVTLA